MGCKRLTEGEYNKIKKVVNAHKVEWLSEKYGYGATVIRQIRRSKNWSDYKKQFIDNKRLKRIMTKENQERIEKMRELSSDIRVMKQRRKEERRKVAREITIIACIVFTASILLVAIIVAAVRGMYGN